RYWQPEARQPEGWTTRSQNAQHCRHSLVSIVCSVLATVRF
ncbi:MAG: hypothetical protein QOF65_1876, partial [Thermoleophilaceae bacterium]|nr:hypothetical protein [Thermoleophilaceae bacterium]